MNVEELCSEARQLSRPKQAELIGRLLEDFGAPEYIVSDDEVSMRVAETDGGQVSDISHEELLEGISQLRKQ
jgi:hypothetical protein